MNRFDFQQLAQVRLDEAKALLDSGLPDGAYYLSGYVVECALKSCVAKQTKQWDFPDKQLVNQAHVHNLKKLLELAGLVVAKDTRSGVDRLFDANWLIVQRWSEQCRYERRDLRTAEDLYNAVADPSHGVLEWIKQYW